MNALTPAIRIVVPQTFHEEGSRDDTHAAIMWSPELGMLVVVPTITS
jgi:hypothetical protein